LVPLKPNGNKSPLFLVHASGGTVSSYAELANRLPAYQPVYGLEASGLKDGQDAIDDVPAMASTYINAIRTVQSKGPYLLGGWSAGGIIAVEMARQFVRAGEKVAFLGLIDTDVSNRADEVDLVPQLIAIAAANDLNLTDEDVAALRALAPEDQLPRFADIVGRQQAPRDSSPARNAINVNQAITRGLKKYASSNPLRYAGHVVLFSCVELIPGEVRPDPYLGWQDMVEGEVLLRFVPGNHFSVVRMPHVAALAAKISESIDRALERWSC
jgi:syringomycin synthetase protein SyrE